jgi:hypothetical protein
MIDFQKSAVFKLKPIDNKGMLPSISKFLIDGENVLRVFQLCEISWDSPARKLTTLPSPIAKFRRSQLKLQGPWIWIVNSRFILVRLGKFASRSEVGFDIVSFNRAISEFVLA